MCIVLVHFIFSSDPISTIISICCGQGNGSYKVTMDGETVAEGGQFGETYTKEFGQCSGGPAGKVEIMTDRFPCECP